MPDTISPTPNEVLQALLQAHGYDAKISGERIVLIGYEAQMGIGVYVHKPDSPSLIQLDVRVHLPDGRTLAESFSSLGSSIQDAFEDAFVRFCQGSFHVLLTAFFGDTHIEPEEWYFPYGSFHAIVGGMSIRGKDVLTQEKARECFERLTMLMTNAPSETHAIHWIRLYYAQHEGKMIAFEVLFGNEVWEQAQDVMSSYSWPQVEELYSVRLFLVLQPQNNPLPPEWAAQWLN